MATAQDYFGRRKSEAPTPEDDDKAECDQKNSEDQGEEVTEDAPVVKSEGRFSGNFMYSEDNLEELERLSDDLFRLYIPICNLISYTVKTTVFLIVKC